MSCFSNRQHNRDSKDCWLVMTWWNTWPCKSYSAKLRVSGIEESSSRWWIVLNATLRTIQWGGRDEMKITDLYLIKRRYYGTDYVCPHNKRDVVEEKKHLCKLWNRWTNLVFTKLCCVLFVLGDLVMISGLYFVWRDRGENTPGLCLWYHHLFFWEIS